MTAVGESDSSLAAKCLDFCQALAGQGLAFNFSLTISSTFSFSLDTRGKGPALVNKGKTKKRSSPSTLRRNARRRAAFLQRKQNPTPATSEVVVDTLAVELPQPEKMPPPSVSPLKVQQRAEHCNTSGVDIASSQLPNPEVIDCEECGEVFKCGEDLEEHTLWCPRCYVFSCLTLNSSSTNCLGCSKPYTLPPKEVCLLLYRQD